MSVQIYLQLRDFNLIYQFIHENLFILRYFLRFFFFSLLHIHFIILISVFVGSFPFSTEICLFQFVSVRYVVANNQYGNGEEKKKSRKNRICFFYCTLLSARFGCLSVGVWQLALRKIQTTRSHRWSKLLSVSIINDSRILDFTIRFSLYTIFNMETRYFQNDDKKKTPGTEEEEEES